MGSSQSTPEPPNSNRTSNNNKPTGLEKDEFKYRELSLMDRITEFGEFLSENKKGLKKGLLASAQILNQIGGGTQTPLLQHLASGIILVSYLIKDSNNEEKKQSFYSNESYFENKDTERLRANKNSDLIQLKKQLDEFKVDCAEMHEMISEMFFLTGCKRIQGQYIAMLQGSSLKEWAQEFFYNKNSFGETLGDFRKENIQSFLESVYKNKCSKSIQPLISSLNYVITMRTIYFHVLARYYDNMPDSAGNGQGPKTIAAKKGLQETELLIESIKMMDEVAVNICPFVHAFKAADKAWGLDIVNVPSIPSTTDNFIGYSDQLLNYFKESSTKCSIYGKTLDCEQPNYIKIVKNNPKTETTCLVRNRELVSGPKLVMYSNGLIVYMDFLETGFIFTFTKKVTGEIVYDKYLRDASNKQKLIEKHEYSSKTMTWKRLVIEDRPNASVHSFTGKENVTAQREEEVKNVTDDGKEELKKGYHTFTDNEKKTDDVEQSCTFIQNVKISEKLVGCLIGKRGENIKKIQKDSGACCKVDRKTLNGVNRHMMIKGTSENVTAALVMITDRIGNHNVRIQKMVWVPRSMVGIIMGRGGDNIKTICNESGAQLKVDERKAVDSGNERFIKISGNPVEVAAALLMIADKVGTDNIRAEMKFVPPPPCLYFTDDWIDYYREKGMPEEAELLCNQVQLITSYTNLLNMKEEAVKIEHIILTQMKDFSVKQSNPIE